LLDDILQVSENAAPVMLSTMLQVGENADLVMLSTMNMNVPPPPTD
jgi:hypothetical protein